MVVQLDEAAATSDPSTVADFGNGFLLQQGFRMRWSAWGWDIAADPREKRLVLKPPVATREGEPITGRVAYEFLVNSPAPTARFTGILGLPYPFAQDEAPDAKLTARDRPEAERRDIPLALWKFVSAPDGSLPQQLELGGGFHPRRLSELTYTPRAPFVVGL